MAAARRHTTARSAYDSWLQDSKVFCAWARRFIASASVSSSNLATTSLLYGLTVRYAVVSLRLSPSGSSPPLSCEKVFVASDYAQLVLSRPWFQDATATLTCPYRHRQMEIPAS